jgi:hypothetical protein
MKPETKTSLWVMAFVLVIAGLAALMAGQFSESVRIALAMLIVSLPIIALGVAGSWRGREAVEHASLPREDGMQKPEPYDARRRTGALYEGRSKERILLVIGGLLFLGAVVAFIGSDDPVGGSILYSFSLLFFVSWYVRRRSYK